MKDVLVDDGLNTTGVGTLGAFGNTLKSIIVKRKTAYNFAFIEDDKSFGVHSPDYAVQLLQQSYEHLTEMPAPSAHILREEQAVSAD